MSSNIAPPPPPPPVAPAPHLDPWLTKVQVPLGFFEDRPDFEGRAEMVTPATVFGAWSETASVEERLARATQMAKFYRSLPGADYRFVDGTMKSLADLDTAIARESADRDGLRRLEAHRAAAIERFEIAVEDKLRDYIRHNTVDEREAARRRARQVAAMGGYYGPTRDELAGIQDPAERLVKSFALKNIHLRLDGQGGIVSCGPAPIAADDMAKVLKMKEVVAEYLKRNGLYTRKERPRHHWAM